MANGAVASYASSATTRAITSYAPDVSSSTNSVEGHDTDRRNSDTWALNSSGASALMRCAMPGMTASFDVGMASDGSTSQIQLPDDGWFPNLITTGPDGNLWVTEWAGNKVIRLTPAGQITEFAASGPLGIASGPDGNIWFTETNNSVIGRVNLD